LNQLFNIFLEFFVETLPNPVEVLLDPFVHLLAAVFPLFLSPLLNHLAVVPNHALLDLPRPGDLLDAIDGFDTR